MFYLTLRLVNKDNIVYGGLDHALTVSLKFGELLGQSVLTLLQVPLLLLHVLHVVSQRLDLGLVLHTDTQTTTKRYYYIYYSRSDREVYNLFLSITTVT